MTKTIKELFGDETIGIVCKSHKDMAEVALVSIDELGAQNDSSTIQDVMIMTGTDQKRRWEISWYKWVTLRDDNRLGRIVMEASDPNDRDYFDFPLISTETFFSQVDPPKFNLTEQEFSEALHELL